MMSIDDKTDSMTLQDLPNLLKNLSRLVEEMEAFELDLEDIFTD
jgi:hypothetical protein